MANVQRRTVERIVGRSLLVTETLASEERARIVRRLAGLFNEISGDQLLVEAAGMLAEFQPILEETIAEAEVAGSIAGVALVINGLPAASKRDIESTPPPGPPGTGGLIFPTRPEDPIITFPVIDRAAESLAQSRVLSRQDFLELGRSARLDAFTVAQVTSSDTLSTIRDVLAETIEEGASLQAFREKLTDGLEGSFLGPAHLETVFRTNVQTRFNNAFRETASDPIVSSIFPYQQYIPIRDDRTREEHRDLETLGLNGTNIYRLDDPFWNEFLPPWDYNSLAPHTLVDGQFTAATRMRYNGVLIRFKTRHGRDFTVTPNHPVLSEHGFVPAGKLAKGQYLVCDRNVRDGVRNAAVGYPEADKNKEPTTAENVFRSLSLKSPLFRCPVRSDDFHGDARHGVGYVDVVRSDRKLLLPAISTESEKLAFMQMHMLQVLLPRNRVFLSNHMAPGFSYHDVRFVQNVVNYLSTAAMLRSEPKDRLPCEVELDDLVVVEAISNWSGHVYDFQARGNLIIAGGAVVHNCRCGINLLTIERAAARGVEEAQEWLRTGVPPVVPEWRLDDIPFRPPPDFQNERLVA